MKNLLIKLIHEKNIQSLSTSLFIAAINLITFLILVRSLGKEGFGEYVIFTTAATLLDLLRFGLTKRALVHFISSGNKVLTDQFKGSGFAIDLVVSASLALLIFLLHLILGEGTFGIYRYVFIFYPFLILASMPWSNAGSVQQAEQRFDRILIFRLLINIPFFIFVMLNYWYFNLGVEAIIIAFIIANIPASLLSTFKNWNGYHLLKKANRIVIKKIVNYGKYTLLTSTGSSLLRSADTLIIGMSAFMGASGVAIYSIPFKIVDLIQIPLNAFVSTASPKLSKHFLNKNYDQFKTTLMTYTGAVSLIFIPIVLLSAIFSQQVLGLFAGEGFSDAFPSMTLILYVVLVYGLILPFDRFTGSALDSAEMPEKNALKVNIMLGLNLVGNVISVFVLKSLVMVAVVSVLFTIFGMVFGWVFLKRKFNLNPLEIFSRGIGFYKNIFQSALSLNFNKIEAG